MDASWAGLFSWLIVFVEGILALLVCYLLVLTLAAAFASRRTSLPSTYSPHTRFAIFIPAHNEERLLPGLLHSLQALDYPGELFDIFVVADNCSDQTGALGRGNGARVYERFDPDLPGKGNALNWLYTQIKAEGLADQYHAFVIFDADTLVDQEFLRVMDARIQRGQKAIQGYYTVRNPDRSWGTAMRYASLAALHFLRPLGRSVIGGSAGLKGNGMCIAAEIYREHQWSGALTEDIEYHTELVLSGIHTTFAPDALLEAEMPNSLLGAYSQNVRWERGRAEMARRYAFPLLKLALLEHRFIALDTLMEHLIPPTALLVFSVLLMAASGILLAWLGRSWGFFWFAILLLAVLAFYLAAGLKLVHAPKKVWLSMFYAPRYALWKLGLLLRVGAGKEREGWVRTAR